MVVNKEWSAVALEHRYSQLNNRDKKRPLAYVKRHEKEDQGQVIELLGDETDLYNFTKLEKKTFSLLPYSTISWLVSSLYFAWVQTDILQRQATLKGWEFETSCRQGFLLLDLICTGKYWKILKTKI